MQVPKIALIIKKCKIGELNLVFISTMYNVLSTKMFVMTGNAVKNALCYYPYIRVEIWLNFVYDFNHL